MREYAGAPLGRPSFSCLQYHVTPAESLGGAVEVGQSIDQLINSFHVVRRIWGSCRCFVVQRQRLLRKGNRHAYIDTVYCICVARHVQLELGVE